MKMIHVTPAPGKVIRNPANEYRELAREGEVVPASEYWTRREAEGGVIISPAE